MAGLPDSLRPVVCAPLLPAGFLLAGFLTGLAEAGDGVGLSASLRLIDPANNYYRLITGAHEYTY